MSNLKPKLRDNYLNMLPLQMRDYLRKMFDRGVDKHLNVSEPAEDSKADMDAGLILLGSGIDLTEFNPRQVGQLVVLWCTDSTVDATVTTGSGITWDGTNDVATFGDAGDALIVVAVSMTRWAVLVNLGSVAFS